MKTKLDLTISIVSYNTRDYLRQCLNSIFENTRGVSFELIVVDNASTDGSAEMVAEEFSSVTLICNEENRYFAVAHNQALKLARGEFFLILNSDTVVPSETISKLATFLEDNKQAGAVTCREVDGSQRAVITSTRFPSVPATIAEWTALRNWPLRKVFDRYMMSHWQRDTARTIEVASGCFIMGRTELLRKFGGFDERIKLYYSEHDLCRQISRAGFTIHFRPEAHYVHFGQRSSCQQSLLAIRKIHFADMRYYFAKYHGRVAATAMLSIIRLLRFVSRVASRISLRLASARRETAAT